MFPQFSLPSAAAAVKRDTINYGTIWTFLIRFESSENCVFTNPARPATTGGSRTRSHRAVKSVRDVSARRCECVKEKGNRRGDAKRDGSKGTGVRRLGLWDCRSGNSNLNIYESTTGRGTVFTLPITLNGKTDCVLGYSGSPV